MRSVSDIKILLFFNRFQHNTVDISTICTNLIALFVAAIYNIYNIYSTKDIFNGLYYSERSSRKMGNYFTPGTSALHTGKNTGCYSVWGYLGKYPRMQVKPKDGRYKSVDNHK